jgi:hypothetical protein
MMLIMDFCADPHQSGYVPRLLMFDVLEEWDAADMAAAEARVRLRSRRDTTRTYADELIAAIKLQIEADELLEAVVTQPRRVALARGDERTGT